MLPLALLALLWVDYIDLVELHGPEGQRYWVNPREITTIREPIHADTRRGFAHITRCIIFTTNGKFIALSDTCEHVLNLVRQRPDNN